MVPVAVTGKCSPGAKAVIQKPILLDAGQTLCPSLEEKRNAIGTTGRIEGCVIDLRGRVTPATHPGDAQPGTGIRCMRLKYE